jgi:uncharacterized membrane protein YhaH (DUF805 family)
LGTFFDLARHTRTNQHYTNLFHLAIILLKMFAAQDGQSSRPRGLFGVLFDILAPVAVIVPFIVITVGAHQESVG